MIFLLLLRWLIIGLFIIFFASQIVVPLWKGTKILPFFSKREKLEEKIENAEDDVNNQSLQKKLNSFQPKPKENPYDDAD